jgi:hypothetical protein
MKIYITLICVLLFSGCITNIEVPVTKQWEGRYDSVEDINKVVKTIELQKNESVWILSNSTLKRLLKQ